MWELASFNILCNRQCSIEVTAGKFVDADFVEQFRSQGLDVALEPILRDWRDRLATPDSHHVAFLDAVFVIPQNPPLPFSRDSARLVKMGFV